jgi:hypothetical protein
LAAEARLTLGWWALGLLLLLLLSILVCDIALPAAVLRVLTLALDLTLPLP